jgi:hypothetical protein
MVWAVLVGLFLGALFTRIAIRYLPDSAGRDFLTTAVSASLGPLGVDLVAVSLVVGPLVVSLNVLSLFGIVIVALIMRSWWF